MLFVDELTNEGHAGRSLRHPGSLRELHPVWSSQRQATEPRDASPDRNYMILVVVATGWVADCSHVVPDDVPHRSWPRDEDIKG